MSAPPDEQRIALRMIELEDRSRVLDALLASLRGSFNREPLPWRAVHVAAELQRYLLTFGMADHARAVAAAVRPDSGGA